ncbi:MULTISPECIES: protein-L-isoaspartate O-methyltransferase family protein [unclassified Brevibacterium]|uniref:protein-L-isoaspartate O-methyltransferase family protein n=1 Tax=unclassified Brevibacterium TaxID=2614124 RepID=UPI000C37274A|nr:MULTISPECIES: protein-L-isoaspartate carboxylmethyltransferase [unclassified Brevibacterium]SMY00395.1 protein-L-isoaspartate(D-aspartate) O-methyltransferase [Brevibacterium sp. 239c]
MASDRQADSLAEAFAQVPRELFLPAKERGFASSNVPLQIGDGQTNSQPSTVADMLTLLGPREGDRVLDLGSGSGWTTALLGVLVGGRGRVSGVERYRRLIDGARASLSEIDPDAVDLGSVEIIAATEGVLGLPEAGPFDRILVSAGSESLPYELVEQLSIGGVMVIPVGGEMLRVVRIGSADSGADADAGITVTRHGSYRFVPLIRD